MAKLNPSLIFSMTRELNELHEIGQEMLEHFGPCKIVSWRFPDSSIKDVEIDLDKLFNDSEKYVYLLELIIDRLYLIINVSVEMFNISPALSNKQILRLPKNVCKPLGLSLGTLLGLFWKRLQILTEPKDKEFSSKPSSTTSLNSVHYSETDFQKCTNCEVALKTIKILISKIIESMEILDLKSVLLQNRQNKEKYAINLTQLDAMKIWTNAVLTDVDYIMNTAQDFKTKSESLAKNYEKCIKESTEKEMNLKIKEIKYAELEKICANLNENIKLEKRKKDDLQTEIDKLHCTINRIEEENLMKTNKIHDLQGKINQIITRNEASEQKIITEFVKQVTDLKKEISHWQELHDKQKNEFQAMEIKIKLEQDKQKQTEANLQNTIAREEQKNYNEKLEIEDENKKLTSALQDLQNQLYQKECEFLTKIHALENEKIKLQDEMRLGKEREEILLKCPDLNGPIECARKQNPLEDMEEQLISNEIRIQLLQQQNIKLNHTVNRLKQIRNK